MRKILLYSLLLAASFAAIARAEPGCRTESFPQYQLEYCLYPAPGPLLVLDAAQGTDMAVWGENFITALNGFAAVLTYNRIGSGKSRFHDRRLDQAVTAKESSERLYQLLQRLAAGRKPILLGHSMGGLYAQYFARAYPQQLAGLVLVDAASALEPRTDSPFKNRSRISKGSVAYYEGLGFQPSVAQIEAAPPFPDIPLLVISADNHQFPEPAIEALWQDIQKGIARQSGRGRQVTVPGSEHFVFLSNRERVVREIAAMVQEYGFR
ncbi:MAG: alpha/beta fold hydrolase [Noviherbaspirillum sp.]